MRLALVLALVVPGFVALDAEAGDAVTLDAHPVADSDLEACLRGGRAPQGSDDELTCKTLASRTIAKQRVRVAGTFASMEDTAYVELAADGGPSYFYFTEMRYWPMMGERGSSTQTERDWSKAPVIDVGTLADGKSAAIVRIPWTSHEYDKDSGRSLGPKQAHAAILICAVGPHPACAQKIDVDCPAKGCTAKLARGALTLVTRDGTEQRQVAR